MAKRAPSHRAQAVADAPTVRSGEEIADHLTSPDDPPHVAKIVEILRTTGLPWGGNRAADALEAVFWIGRARAHGWAWEPGSAQEVVPAETEPAVIGLPGWVVEELACAWVAYSRARTVQTMDEAFGLKAEPGQHHPVTQRLNLQSQSVIGWQTEDVKQRGSLGDGAAREIVAEHLGLTERWVADHHRFITRGLKRKQPPEG